MFQVLEIWYAGETDGGVGLALEREFTSIEAEGGFELSGEEEFIDFAHGMWRVRQESHCKSKHAFTKDSYEKHSCP